MILALIFNVLLAGSATAENCIPPVFYTSLPRDSEWFYGAARDQDTEKARDSAVRSLGKQVGGGISGWDDRQIAEIAGPGHDRTRVSEIAESILSQTPLSGWEQDDFQRCNGYSYVLVRVPKESARRFLAENAKFHAELLQRLENKVTQMGGDLESLKRAYANLAADLEALKNRQRGRTLQLEERRKQSNVEKIVDDVKTRLDHGQVDPELNRKIIEAISALADLKQENVDALARYDRVLKIDKSMASAAEKARTWRALADAVPTYAPVAQKRAADWERRVSEEQALAEDRMKRITVRDADWAKVGKLLSLDVVPESEKKTRAQHFAQAYLDSPGLEVAMANALRPFLSQPLKDQVLPKAALRGMVLIPAGKFKMGAPDEVGEQNEHPRHEVFLNEFYLDRYLVNSQQFGQFCAATKSACGHDEKYWRDSVEMDAIAGEMLRPTELPHWYCKYSNRWINSPTLCGYVHQDGDGRYYSVALERRPNWIGLPAEDVNWSDADAYCKWAGKRLPSEAEWERAARGGNESKYGVGDTVEDLLGSAWIRDDSSVVASAMGMASGDGLGEKNPNPYGLYDMIGTVQVWVADGCINSSYGFAWATQPKPYTRGIAHNPMQPTSSARDSSNGLHSWHVLRGCDRSDSAEYCRPSIRHSANYDATKIMHDTPGFGFRCARNARQ